MVIRAAKAKVRFIVEFKHYRYDSDVKYYAVKCAPLKIDMPQSRYHVMTVVIASTT